LTLQAAELTKNPRPAEQATVPPPPQPVKSAAKPSTTDPENTRPRLLKQAPRALVEVKVWVMF
jgi:hypothetical protein